MFNVWPFIRRDAAHHRIANDAVLGSALIADDAIFFGIQSLNRRL